MDYSDLAHKALLNEIRDFTNLVEEFTEMLYADERLEPQDEMIRQINILRRLSDKVSVQFDSESKDQQ